MIILEYLHQLERILYPGTIFFFGLWYSCNNYGHKSIDCRCYAWNINKWRKNNYENSKYQFEGNYVRKPCEAFDINDNLIQ